MIARFCFAAGLMIMLTISQATAQPLGADYQGRISEDGRYYIAVSMSDDANVYIYKITKPEEPLKWNLRKIHVSSLGLAVPCCGIPLFRDLILIGMAQDGTRLVYIAADERIRIYDLKNNRVIYTSSVSERGLDSSDASIQDRAGLMGVYYGRNGTDLVSLRTGAVVMSNRCPANRVEDC